MKPLPPLLFAGLLGFFPTSLRPSNSLYGGFVPSADGLFYVEVANAAQSPFFQKLKDLIDQHQQKEMENPYSEIEKGFLEVFRNVTDVVGSVDLDEIPIEEGGPIPYETLSAVMAVGLKEPATLESVLTCLPLFLEEGAKQDRPGLGNLVRERRQGLDLIVITPPAEKQGPEKILITLTPDGKTLLVAANVAALRQALARIDQRKLDRPGRRMPRALLELKGMQGRMVVLIPDLVKQQIDDARANSPNPRASEMSILQGGMFSFHADERLDLRIRVDLETPDMAKDITKAHQAFLAQFILEAGTDVPMVARLLSRVRIETEGRYSLIRFHVTQADLEEMFLDSFLEPFKMDQ